MLLKSLYVNVVQMEACQSSSCLTSLRLTLFRTGLTKTNICSIALLSHNRIKQVCKPGTKKCFPATPFGKTPGLKQLGLGKRRSMVVSQVSR